MIDFFRGRVGTWLLRIFGAIVVVWLVAPLLVMIPLGFAGEASFEFPPKSFSLQWYDNLFSDPQWTDAILNSIKIALIVVVVSSVVGTACAFGLDRGRLPGKAAVRAFALMPMVVPLVVIAVGVYTVYLEVGLVGGQLGFILAHSALALPFVFVAVSTSLSGFDRRLEQASASLGASPWTTFVRVTLPSIAPGIFAGAVLAFITSFDEIVVALFLSTPLERTLPVQIFNSLSQIDPTIAAAATVVLAATSTVVALAFVFNRDFRSGKSS
jgi:putative spermidine/putrescine transport system permease protein